MRRPRHLVPRPSLESPSISIAGPATLVVGQVLQFTATTAGGQDVTVQSDWTTSTRQSPQRRIPDSSQPSRPVPSVTITASYQTSFASISVAVNPSVLSSPAITACGMITSPGSYFLDADISQVPGAGLCVTITAAGVHLDCRNHSVSGVLVSGTSDVTVSNCNVTAVSSATLAIEVRDASSVTLDHNSTSSTIELIRGDGNAVIGNSIDGHYNGQGGLNGSDDGILLDDQTNGRIQGNTIQDVFDAGVEGVDAISNTVVSGNTIVNAGAAGVASYFCTSWTGNTVSGNSVSRAGNPVFFNYMVGKCLDGSTPGAFVNNRMSGNTSRDMVAGGAPGAMYFDFSNLPTSSVTGNLIQDNDMGTAPGPFTIPASGFINGGGNVCGSPQNPFCGG